MLLTNEQQNILDNYNTNIFINAAAGTGKSTLLSKIAEKVVQEQKTNNILLLTFSNKAAKSIISKCANINKSNILGGTFHGMSNYFMKLNGSNWNICDEGKKRLIIKRLFNCKKDKEKLESYYDEISFGKMQYPINFTETILKYNNELSKYNLVDFDDIIYNFIIAENLNLPNINFLLCDELQDTNLQQLEMIKKIHKISGCKIIGVGDTDQCIVKGSLINTPSGKTKVENINIGDLVETFNGKTTVFYPVSNKSINNVSSYYNIVTDKGELNLTYNHICYAKPVFNKYFVYLMYRYDKGFRIGKSHNSPESRSQGEKADKIWVLDVFDNNETASLQEDRLSLLYGIPKQTYVKHSKTQLINNNIKLFKEFGNNGFKLLKDRDILFDNPVIQTQTAKEKRIAVSLTQAKIKNRSKLSFMVTCEHKFLNLAIFNDITIKSNSRNIIRKQFSSYKDAFLYVNKIKYILKNKGFNVELQERINIKNSRYIAINAAQIKKDFKLIYKNNFTVEKATVLSVNKIVKTVNTYDLEVEKTGKIFVNDHLVHNCIYGFQGARFENINDFVKEFNCKVFNMGLNFRCPIKVVKCADNVIKHNKKRFDKILTSAKTEEGHVSEYMSKSPLDEINYVIGKCRQNSNNKIAILYRNRLYKNHLEFALKKAGLKYCVNDSLEISDRSAIKVMISSMKIAAGIGDIYDLEIASKGLTGIGKTTINGIKKEIGDKSLSLFLRDKFLDPKNHKKFNSLISIISYFNNNKGIKLNILTTFIEKYFIKSFDYQEDMKLFLHDITKDYLINTSDIRSISNDLGLDGKVENQDNDANIELSTVHGFKGSEQSIILLPWCNQFNPQNGKEYNIEDERRLFYVAITRAKSKLYVSYSGDQPRFIKELNI